jgi:hypothetical protein
MAAAVRAVNAAYVSLPEAAQGLIEIGCDGLGAEVDAAILAGDRDRALAAINAWKRHWLATFEETTPCL